MSLDLDGFTICLFISPDLDGNRAPRKALTLQDPTRSRNPSTDIDGYRQKCFTFVCDNPPLGPFIDSFMHCCHVKGGEERRKRSFVLLCCLSRGQGQRDGRWQGGEQLQRREREKGPVLKGVDDEGVALHQPLAESHKVAHHAATRAFRARPCGCHLCPDVGTGHDLQFMQRAAAVDAAKRALDGPSKVEKDAADEDGDEGQGRVAVFEGVSDPIIKYCPGRRSFGRCVSLLVLPISMVPPAQHIGRWFNTRTLSYSDGEEERGNKMEAEKKRRQHRLNMRD